MVNMLEARIHLSRLEEAIETGAETEVVIARNGRPVARLTSLQPAERPLRLGIACGWALLRGAAEMTVPHGILRFI